VTVSTNAQVGVDTGISCCSRQVLVLTVWNVLMCPCVTILLSKPKVYYIHKVALFAKTHQEVVWFNISVYQVLGMNVLHTTYLQPQYILCLKKRCYLLNNTFKSEAILMIFG